MRAPTSRTLVARHARAPTTDADDADGVPRALAILLAAQLILFIGVGAVIPVIPLYGQSLGLSASSNGIVISAPAVALLLCAKPAGSFADRARKPAMIAGMILIAVSDIGTASATTLATLVAARLGLGAGRCVAESGERGFLADLASRAPELRGRALAASQAAAAIGITVGAPLGGLLVERSSERACFLVVSACAIVVAAIYTLLPETADTPSDADKPGADWGELIADSRWRGIALAEIGQRFGYAAKISTVPLIASALAADGRGAVAAGALVSAAGAGGLAGAPLGGLLVDSIGARQTALAAGLVGGASFVAVPFAINDGDGAARFTACVVLWAIAIAVQGPAVQACAQKLAPKGAEAEAMAFPRAAGDLVYQAAYVAAPFLLGLVADAGLPRGSDVAVAGALGAAGSAALALDGLPSPPAVLGGVACVAAALALWSEATVAVTGCGPILLPDAVENGAYVFVTLVAGADVFSRIAFGRAAHDWLETPAPALVWGERSSLACVVGACVALGFQVAHGNQMDPVTGIDGLYCRSLIS